jgi:hypothetical protein
VASLERVRWSEIANTAFVKGQKENVRSKQKRSKENSKTCKGKKCNTRMNSKQAFTELANEVGEEGNARCER